MDHPDRPRLQRLLDDFFSAMEKEVADFEGDIKVEDIAVDDATLIAIVTHRDEQGNLSEQPFMISTSKRRATQLGIIESAKQRHIQLMFFPDDEDQVD